MKTLIFDGNNALWRLAKRLPRLTAKGEPIQVVYGFMRLLHGALVDFEPEKALVVWDGDFPRLRVEIWDGYKAHRRHRKEERRAIPQKDKEYKEIMSQMEIIKKMLHYLGVQQVVMKDIEADDVIAFACEALDGDKLIISADQDMMQLVGKHVSVWSPIKKILYTRKTFEEHTGLTPRQFLHVRILSGDTTDGIPAIAENFGFKTAKDLVQKFGSIEDIFKSENEKKIKKMGIRHARVLEGDSFRLVWRNSMLMDLKIHKSRIACKRISKMMIAPTRYDKLKVKAFFQKKGFDSLLSNFAVWMLPFSELQK